MAKCLRTGQCGTVPKCRRRCLQDRAGTSLPPRHALPRMRHDSERLAVQWGDRLASLAEVVAQGQKIGPDEDLAHSVRGHSQKLLELAKRWTRYSKVRRAIDELLSDFTQVLETHTALTPYSRAKARAATVESSSASMEVVEDLRCQLRSLSTVQDTIQTSARVITEVSPDRQSEVIEQLQILSQQRNDHIKVASHLLNTLFPEIAKAAPAIPTTPPSDPPDRFLQVSPTETHVDTEQDNANESVSAPEHSAVAKEQDLDQIDTVTVTDPSHDPTSSEIVAEPTTIDTAQATDRPYRSTEAGPETTDVDTERDHGKRQQSTSESPEVVAKAKSNAAGTKSAISPSLTIETRESGLARAGTDSDMAQPVSSTDTEVLLERLLSDGRFARAYWLARTDPSILEPSLLGAFCEAARISPGDSCSGLLSQLLDDLAHKQTWNDDEKIYLCGTLLNPCLYLDPLPPSIYVLTDYLPTEPKSMLELWGEVCRICVYQATKIRPIDLGSDARDTDRDTPIKTLSKRAESALIKVPYIRSMYRPADSALRKLYREGSDWHTLHAVVAEDQRSFTEEVKSLCDRLEPRHTVATLHENPDLVTLTRPLEGSVRAKLERYLHKSLSMAREWLRLVSVDEGVDDRETQQQRHVAKLVKHLRTVIPKCLQDLDGYSNRGSTHALTQVLANTLNRIQQENVTAPRGIQGDLIGLIGLPLDDDLEPCEDTLESLRPAILRAEVSSISPADVLKECLTRHEYRRANLIIHAHGLGPEAQEAYESAVKESRRSLRDELLNLETQVEDAFLLGQLRDTTLEMTGDEAHELPVLERTRLIAKLQEAKANLESSEQSEADSLREIAETARSVSGQIKDLASRRRHELAERFENVIKDLPKTDQGRSDRAYLERAFEACRSQNDDVAAFDLLERGLKAIQKSEPIARSTIGLNDKLETFLSKIDKVYERLDRVDWLKRSEKAIRRGKPIAGIDFAHLDKARRQEAVGALYTWETLGRIRFTAPRGQLESRIAALGHFLGLRIDDRSVSVEHATRDGCAPRRRARRAEALRAAVLRKRWREVLRSRRAGGGCKPPTAAAFKRRGGERARKRQDVDSVRYGSWSRTQVNR